MNLMDSIKLRAKNKKMKIVLPEINDNRILEAASIAINNNIADIILVGNETEIEKAKSKYNLQEAHFINPNNSSLTNSLIKKFVDLRKHKGITYDIAKELLLNNYIYYACMLVKAGVADGVVGGACHSSADVLRPALQIIKTKPNKKIVSAFFLLDVPNCNYGDNGIFIFADSGLNQNPNEQELANIAIDSADSFKLLINSEPKVAMISHSTKGSANHPDILKMVNATKIAKEKKPNLKIDGELQVDAAIVPEIANIKVSSSDVAGHANVLIFPNLDAGNSGYKLVERLAKAKAYGPITQGMDLPVNDLSRGCNIEDIIGVIAITALQAQNNKIKE